MFCYDREHTPWFKCKRIRNPPKYNATATFTIHTRYQKKAQKRVHREMRIAWPDGYQFRRLLIDGKDYGVNAFIVPFTRCTGAVLKGITIADCGT
jgi:acyl-CoA oxidase